jgi:hypothetical protein
MATKVHVVTSAALNYLPKARILFRSLRHYHPTWKLHLALADDLPQNFDLSCEPFDAVLPISNLGIEEWNAWSFCHNITELATAIKPFAMKHLLKDADEGCIVIYLDPDMEIYSSLDDIISALGETSIALTPHQTQPESSLEDVINNEITISLKHGVYNLGFIGLSKGTVADAFAEWWSNRVYYFCRDNTAHGLFTDQRWIDLVPCFFPDVAIIRTPRHNVAPWNLTTRKLTQDSNGNYIIDGEPLGIYHFTGLDSGAHDRKSKRLLSENPLLKPLLEDYKARLSQELSQSTLLPKWAFGCFSDGTPITNDHRLVYRMRRDLQIAFPNPYEAEGFLSWWRSKGGMQLPELFNEYLAASYRASLLGNITPGFLPPSCEDEKNQTGLVKLFLKIREDPRLTLRLAARGWEVLWNQGPKALTRLLG